MPRINLSEAIPLPAPFTLYIEPTNVCNFRCEMCPESFPDYAEQAGYYGRMPMDLYEKILSDLKHWGQRLKVIRFFHEGEPLLNPDLEMMVLKAHLANAADRLEVFTNGSMLREHRAARMPMCGLTYIRVSFYGVNDQQYKERTGKAGYTFDEIVRNVRTLRRYRDAAGGSDLEIHAQLIGGTEDEERFLRSTLDGIADRVDRKQLHNWGSVDSRLVQLGQEAKTDRAVCPQPFMYSVVKANGDVTVCCVDWAGKLVVGNVQTESLREIWEGQRLRELQNTHLRGRRANFPICRDCTLLYTMPDVIEPRER